MCTLLLLHRPDADWPLLLAANRDEMLARPWLPPGAHWADLPGVVGGRDVLAGGTWLGVNRQGVVAGVLNRTGELGPQEGKRSRGDLPLMALAYASAAAAAGALAAQDSGQWRPFNLVVADATHAFFVRGLGQGPVQVAALPVGLAMVTAADPNDLSHPRVARHLARFAAAAPPAPPDWGAWPALLADSDGDWQATLNVPARGGFGTASSALIGVRPGEVRFDFAVGTPGPGRFQRVVWG